MTEREGIDQGLVPIRDFIPSDTPCTECGKSDCDTYSVKGYQHEKCYKKYDKNQTAT